MDLKEFTKETISQILDSIDEIESDVSLKGATVRLNNQYSNTPWQIEKDIMVLNVDFDIAVSASEKSGRNGKAGLKVAVFNAEGKSETSSENQTTSRVKFTLPLVLQNNE